RLYQIVFRSDFLGAFQVLAFAFPFPAVPTLSEVFGRSYRRSFLSNQMRFSDLAFSDFLAKLGKA
ncbi:hypothetical protein ACWDCL_29205, partial [Streptomyces sp. NPDC001009]